MRKTVEATAHEERQGQADRSENVGARGQVRERLSEEKQL